ncbi:hypothetical protein GMORB2_4909 [Geosmithia morbida]|uniref:Uncharacterized protein n=1 Tax=Geosmithia morbida TaxID=1094350 RepID=A0A9P5D105_9HYPO|nr:uncharacterized protein GMORB2_4909 [Geosmithia morbida]KAF4119390.1 hypothetical protein GMORB2_4909 [Geosmithia morbida]
MPSRLVPLTVHSAALAAARFLAWILDLAALLVLGYTVRRWSELGASTAAGFVGAAIAILNDSWEVASRFDPADHFPTLRAARTAMHDLISLAICLGGVMILLFTEASNTNRESDDWKLKRRYLTMDQAFLATISYVSKPVPLCRLGWVHLF